MLINLLVFHLFILSINSGFVYVQFKYHYNNHAHPICFWANKADFSLTIQKLDDSKFEIVASSPNFNAVVDFIKRTYSNGIPEGSSFEAYIQSRLQNQGHGFLDLLTFVCGLVR